MRAVLIAAEVQVTQVPGGRHVIAGKHLEQRITLQAPDDQAAGLRLGDRHALDTPRVGDVLGSLSSSARPVPGTVRIRAVMP